MGFLKTIAAGGQTWAHRVRMLRQVLKIAILSGTIAFTLHFGWQVYQFPQARFYSLWYQTKAEVLGLFQQNVEVSTEFWEAISSNRYPGTTVTISPTHLKRVCKRINLQTLDLAWDCLASAEKTAGAVFMLFIAFFLFRGLTSKKKRHISGQRRASGAKTRLQLLLKNKASPIKIGNLPMVKGTETQHTLISGGTGSGKTNAIHTMLPQIRGQGQRAIIVDTTGEFVSKYYREGKDILLNPFDARSATWHPWVECRDITDLDSMAQSFIPLSYCEKDNYWRTAARSVLSAALEFYQDMPKTSLLSKLMLYEPLNTMYKVLRDTRAASHLDPSSDKTAGSIRSVATTFLECLDFIEDTEEPFSIRDWIEFDQEDDNWLFIATTVSQRSTMVPLVSAWFSIAMRSLLQLPIDIDRRLWFVADELPSLQRLRDLETCLTESRKFGGCALLAIQSPAQLEAIYGPQTSKIIMGNCSTRLAFFEQDPSIAAQISKTFGEKEVEEFQEGISYGAHEMRDGVSLSSQLRTRPVISASDIQSLDRNEAYVKLPGKLPVTKVKLKYKHTPSITEGFEPKSKDKKGSPPK